MTATLLRRTRAKICGITCVEDGLVATAAGADAIGLVFYEKSPRSVTAKQAKVITAALPPFVTTVGLFVDASLAEVEAVLDTVPLDLLQFHGSETPEYCRQFARPYIKAVRMAEGIDLKQEAERFCDARGLLVDSYQKGVPGGTGHAFDWARIPTELDTPIILAGGLNPDNVVDAIRQVHPYAVDVSSGVEREKGVKDTDKVFAFMRGVDTADGD